MKILTIGMLILIAFASLSIGFIAGMDDPPGKSVTIACWGLALLSIASAVAVGVWS